MSVSSLQVPLALLLLLLSSSSVTRNRAVLAEEDVSTCTLCFDGSNVTFPEKKLPFLQSSFDAVPTCEEFDAYLQSKVDGSSAKCNEAQIFSPVCGCPVAQQDPCEFCRGEEMPDPDRTFPQITEIYWKEWQFRPATCALIEAFFYSVVPANSTDCDVIQDYSYLCGCSVRMSELIRRRLLLLAWLPRISAVLSLFGSSFIIYDVWKKSKQQKGTTQHHLLLAMSCVDVLSSTAWVLSTIPIPAKYPNGQPTIYYGARGNKATCKAQGFFIQLGFASPFCNLSLAVYYMLVVLFDWSEDRIKKHRRFIIGTPLFVGLVLACAGIPFYDVSATMCYVTQHAPVFITVPISIVIFFATLITLAIYVKVYHTSSRALRWNAGSHVQSLPRRVFWQSFWYLACFYVSWPILLVIVSLPTGDLHSGFGFLCSAMFVAPLQGFLNAVYYFRQRIMGCMKSRRHSNQTLTQTGDYLTTHASSPPSTATHKKLAIAATDFPPAGEVVLAAPNFDTTTMTTSTTTYHNTAGGSWLAVASGGSKDSRAEPEETESTLENEVQ